MEGSKRSYTKKIEVLATFHETIETKDNGDSLVILQVKFAEFDRCLTTHSIISNEGLLRAPIETQQVCRDECERGRSS